MTRRIMKEVPKVNKKLKTLLEQVRDGDTHTDKHPNCRCIPVVGVPEPLQVSHGGSTRTSKAERRELIPKSAIDAMARRLALGAEKHGEGNWRLSLRDDKGLDEFRKATLNHLLDHVFDYLENGNVNDAKTDAIICNAAFLCEYELQSPMCGAGVMPVQKDEVS